MRIALVHSFYRSDQPSGENTVVALEADLLRSRGHEVAIIGRSSDDLGTGAIPRLTAGWNVATGGGADPSDELRAFAPDITHVHNLFPNFATTWLAGWRGPIVATLHNYRSVCVNAVLFRDGHVCTLCPDGRRWAGVRHGCYRDSALASLPLAWRNRRGLGHDPLLRRADRILVLSPRAHDLFTRAGAERLRVVPNGIDVPPPEPSAGGSGWVFVGRLTAEKGVAELLRWWPRGVGLDVIGSGPLDAQLRALAPAGVRFLGSLPRDELLARLPGYRGLLFPGVIPEGAYPLVVIEAWACGLPVLVRSGGAGADLVARFGHGRAYRDAGELADRLRQPPPPGNPRSVYEAEFSAGTWADRLESVFAECR